MKTLASSIIVIAIATATMLVYAAEPDAANITRIFNKNGWDIPGLRGAHIVGAAHTGHERNAVPYQTTILVPDRQSISKLPIVWLDSAQRRYSYEELNVQVERITAFEVKAKPYCYKVEAMVYSRGSQSKAGGWGGVLDVWYYDEAGEGQWTIMDTRGPVPPEVPMPPRWATTERR